MVAAGILGLWRAVAFPAAAGDDGDEGGRAKETIIARTRTDPDESALLEALRGLAALRGNPFAATDVELCMAASVRTRNSPG